jgi:hypothetical protein
VTLIDFSSRHLKEQTALIVRILSQSLGYSLPCIMMRLCCWKVFQIWNTNHLSRSGFAVIEIKRAKLFAATFNQQASSGAYGGIVVHFRVVARRTIGDVGARNLPVSLPLKWRHSKNTCVFRDALS